MGWQAVGNYHYVEGGEPPRKMREDEDGNSGRGENLTDSFRIEGNAATNLDNAYLESLKSKQEV